MRIVQPHELSDIWPKVQGWIEEAIEYGQGDENALDVLIGISRGAYVLWYEPEKFAGVVQIVRYPRQTVATVLYAGGSGLEEIRQAFSREGLSWAQAGGIDCVRIWGRKGWERLLGMKSIGAIMQLDLRAQGGLQ